MLTIRNEQSASMSAQRFEHALSEHARATFPAHASALGESGLRDLLRGAVAAAKSLGFEAETEVAQYVDLVFAFGEGFERDPNLPWAARVLGDRTLADPGVVMHRLQEEARIHLRRLVRAEEL
jgi:hypothetical protein